MKRFLSKLLTLVMIASIIMNSINAPSNVTKATTTKNTDEQQYTKMYIFGENQKNIQDTNINLKEEEAKEEEQESQVYTYNNLDEFANDRTSYIKNEVLPFNTPTGLRTITTSDFIVLIWDIVPNAERYELEFDGQIIDCGNKTLFVQSDIKDTNVHKYRVRAINSQMKSEWSAYVEGSKEAEKFDAPKNIVSLPTEESIIVCWNIVNGATGYDVEVDGIIKENGLSTDYINYGLKPNTKHAYRVRAKKDDNVYSEWSDVLETSTLSETPKTKIEDKGPKVESDLGKVNGKVEMAAAKELMEPNTNETISKSVTNELEESSITDNISKTTTLNENIKVITEEKDTKINDNLKVAYEKLNFKIENVIANIKPMLSATSNSINQNVIQYKTEAYMLDHYGVIGWMPMGIGSNLGQNETPIQKFKISPVTKPNSTTIMKYQAYVYDTTTKTGAWQAVKTEGQEAGEIGKVITSIKIWLEGTNYDIQYNAITNLRTSAPVMSGYVMNGAQTFNPSTNIKPITAFAFGIIEALPKVDVQAYGDYNGTKKWSNIDEDSDGFFGSGKNPINKIKLISSKKPAGFILKYQVYIKENNAWQDWKSEGEEAGEDAKTITNIRAKIEGAQGYFLRYNFKTIIENSTAYTSSYGDNGKEPPDSNSNLKPIGGVYYEICKGVPGLEVLTFQEYENDIKTWSFNGFSPDYYGDGEMPINKFIIKLNNKPRGTTIKYQVFLKTANMWQAWKNEGEIAGLDNDTFTSIRIKLEGETLGNSIKYCFSSSAYDDIRYTSEFGYNGVEPTSSLSNTKPIAQMNIYLYSQVPISNLNTSGSEIVIDQRFEIPVGTEFVIPAGKKIRFDYSKCSSPGFLVNGTLKFQGTSTNPITIIDDKGFGTFEISETGSLITNYVNLTSVNADLSWVDGYSLITNKGVITLRSSSFLGGGRNVDFLNSYSSERVSIDNCSINNWNNAITIDGIGSADISHCQINSNRVGIRIKDEYSINDGIDINMNSLNNNETGILVERLGDEPVHKQLIILFNDIDRSSNNGIKFVCNKLDNIMFGRNVISGTNSTRSASNDSHGPICFNLDYINDTGEGSYNFINSINTTNDTFENFIEEGNSIDGIVLYGELSAKLILLQGKYKFVLDNTSIINGAPLFLEEGCRVVIYGTLFVQDGILMTKGTKEKPIVISSINDINSPISHISLPSDENLGFLIWLDKGGIISTYTNFYNGGNKSLSQFSTIQSNGELKLNNCIIDNGSNKSCDGINVYSGSIELTEVVIKNCNIGIYTEVGGTIVSSTISYNDKGIHAQSQGSIIIGKCNIMNNITNGVVSHVNTDIRNSNIYANKYNVTANLGFTKKIIMYHNDIKNGDHGIWLINATDIDIRLNNIVNNRLYGLTSDGSSIKVPNNYWGHPNGPTAYYFYIDRYGVQQRIRKVYGDAVENYDNNIDFSSYAMQEISRVGIGIDEDKISSDAYKILIDYAYNLKKAMFTPGVNPGSGNYSKSYTDLFVNSPGIDINISRTYSSMNTKSGILGQGWSFYYNASLVDLNKENPTVTALGKTVHLPGGEMCSFQRQADGSYIAMDSRNTLTESSGTFILKKKDGTSYKYNSLGKLFEIVDNKYNKLYLTYNGDLINTIYHTLGRQYKFNYLNGLLDTIQEKIEGVNKRIIKYNYNTNNLLKSVTDVNGHIQDEFEYDGTKKLFRVKRANVVLEEIIYFNTGDNKDKIQSIKKENGLVTTYSYDNSNRSVTMTDNLNKKTQIIYDGSLNTTYTIDQDGYSTITNYALNRNNDNVLAEVISTKDKFGYVTQYERDERGNIITVIFPDLFKKQYEYDKFNNVIKEIDQNGNKTFYVYDPTGASLLNVIVPLNGTDEFTSTSDKTKFAITTYDYEALATAENVLVVLKTVVKPSGAVIKYTHDLLGNLLTDTDEKKYIMIYTYDEYNNIKTERDRNGKITSYTYDNKGNMLTKTDPLLYKQERIFDQYDQLSIEISPNMQGKVDAEGKQIATKKYTYNNSGQLEIIKDSLGNLTKYTYDKYGNKESEKNSQGGIYLYEYDNLSRQSIVKFKESETSTPVLLNEFFYSIEEVKQSEDTNLIKVIQTTRVYSKAGSYVETIDKYNHLGKITEHINVDGSRKNIGYDGVGNITSKIDENKSQAYYYYDENNRLVKSYEPVKIESDKTKYRVIEIEYDIDGYKTKEKIGLNLVDKDGKSNSYYTKSFYNDLKGYVIDETDSENRKTFYSYYPNSTVVYKAEYPTATKSFGVVYEYYDNNRLKKETNNVTKGDLEGNNIEDTTGISLYTEFFYDKNGNITMTILKDGSTIEMKYDDLNRLTERKRTIIGTGVSNKIVVESYLYLGNTDKITEYTDGEGFKTVNSYNKMFQLEKIIYDDGSSIEYEYDYSGKEMNKIIKDQYSLNQKKFIKEYDANGRVILEKYETKDSKGVLIQVPIKGYQYDLVGNIVKVVDGKQFTDATGTNTIEKIANSKGIEYTYDLDNKVTSILKPESKIKSKTFTLKFENDVFGRKVKETDAYGNYFIYTLDSKGTLLEETFVEMVNGIAKAPVTLQKNVYDGCGNLISAVDGNGIKKEYEINSLGKIKTVKLPGDVSIAPETYSYQYDKLGNEAVKISSSGKVERKKWNSLNKIIYKLREGKNIIDNIEESYGYDRIGNLTSYKDAKGNLTTYMYDIRGNVIEKISNGKSIHRYQYDSLNNLVSSTDRYGNRIINIYDDCGRFIEKKDAYGVTIEINEYDLSGNLLVTKDALGNTTTFSYDLNNRLLSTTDAEGKVTSQGYDELDRVTSKTDGNLNTTNYRYDGLGRLKYVENALLEISSYIYDWNGNKLSFTDALGNVTTYEYNAANKIYKIIAPNTDILTGKVQEFTYNADGTINTVKDRNGNVISYQYDDFGRKKTESDGSNILSYQYDKVGNLLKVTNSADPTGSTTFIYDGENRVLQKSICASTETILKYTYDVPAENTGEHKVIIQDNKGGTITETYDKMNRLIAVNDGSKVVKYTYFANGSKSETLFPDGSKEVYTYYKDLTLDTLSHINSTGQATMSFMYKYDNNKNITQIIDSKGITRYSYDKLNRLSIVISPTFVKSNYSYDKAGNRFYEKVTKGQTFLDKVYVYDLENRLTKTVGNLTGITLETNFIYDYNGNQVSEITTDSTLKNIIKDRSLSYDKYNRLVEVKEGGKTLEKNYYNYDGLRVQKETEGKKVNYIYDGTNIVLALNDAGEKLARNVFGTKLVSRETGGQKGYYRYNGHGDVVQIFDENGLSLASYYYDSFGNLKEETGSFDNPFRYSGYVYDKEVDYYYLQSRMYDASEGRFIQEDTFRGNSEDPLSLNLYTYCANNPLIYDDPTGHFLEKLLNGAKKLISKAYNGAKKIVSNIYDGAKKIVSNAVDFVTGLFSVKGPGQSYNDYKQDSTDNMNIVKTQVAKIENDTKARVEAAVKAVKGVDIAQLVSSVVSVAVGITAVATGVASMPLPIPGAQLAGVGLISSGLTSITYGSSEFLDSTIHVNPIKGFAMGMGMSETDYHMIGFMSGGVSAYGAGAVAPYTSGGGKVTPRTTKGTTKADDFAKTTFLPDEFYDKQLHKQLPKHVTPGTKSLPKYDEIGNLKQTKYYDQYGREKGWVDYTNHGFKDNHTAPHWHEVEYDNKYPLGRIIDHRMDTNPPFE